MGKASDTAVNASSLIFATKILSTILYNAIMSIENIIGSDILRMSFIIGITPILFSAGPIDLTFTSSIDIPYKIYWQHFVNRAEHPSLHKSSFYPAFAR